MKPIREMVAREWAWHGVEVVWVDETHPTLCCLRMGRERFEGHILNAVELNIAINAMAKRDAEAGAWIGRT